MSEQRIPLGDIIVPEIKLRGIQDKDPSYIDLLSSIDRHGVLEPIVVRPATMPGKFLLIDGLQRFSCSVRANKPDIPVRVENNVRGDDHALLLSVVLNLHRVKTKPYEYAQALRRYVRRNPDMDLDDLAKEIGKPKAWVLERLSLTNLTDEVGKLVDEGRVSVKAGMGLAMLAPADQLAMLPQADMMNAQDFYDTCVRKKRSVVERHVTNRYDEPEYRPMVRTRKEIVEEYKTGRELNRLINNNPNISQAEIWNYALEWVLSIDPVSLQKRRDYYEAKLRRRDEREHQLKNREARKGNDDGE